MINSTANQTEKRRPEAWLLSAAAVCAAVLYFFNAQAVSSGVRSGLAICASALIPSLFPFMLLCSFMVNSRLIDYISAPFAGFTVRILRLPAFTGAVFLLSLVGGYPVGARAIAELLREKRISSDTASHMLCFCVNAGPAFLVTAVGAHMFGSPGVGVMLFAAQTAASIAVAVLCRFWGRKPDDMRPLREPLRPLADAFTEAVTGTAKAIIHVCAFVTAFSAILSLFYAINTPVLLARALPFIPVQMIAAALTGFFEVTLGCAASAQAGKGALLLVSALCSFGGLSVIGQTISSFAGLTIRKLPYLASRVVHGAFSCLTLSALFRLFPDSVPVFAPLPSAFPRGLSATPIASCALLLLCAALILCRKERIFL